MIIQKSSPTAHQHKPRPPAPEAGTIRMPGVLAVKRINGRNGAFCVGDLRTSIGDFRVKDTLIDQFDEGEYSGIFWVRQIFSKSYEYRGRITIETRASIADLQIDYESDAPPELKQQEDPDPVDEAPFPAPPSVVTLPVSSAIPSVGAPEEKTRTPIESSSDRPGGINTSGTQDLELFGTEQYCKLRGGLAFKLDPTVERLKFRAQVARLKALNYEPDHMTQTWSPKNN